MLHIRDIMLIKVCSCHFTSGARGSSIHDDLGRTVRLTAYRVGLVGIPMLVSNQSDNDDHQYIEFFHNTKALPGCTHPEKARDCLCRRGTPLLRKSSKREDFFRGKIGESRGSKGTYRGFALDCAGGGPGTMVTPDRLSNVFLIPFPVSFARRRDHHHAVAEPTAVPSPSPTRKEAG